MSDESIASGLQGSGLMLAVVERELVSVFPDELYQAPQSWVERAYPRLIHYNKVSAGGHFAAWEQPRLFVDELRTGFRPLRHARWHGSS